jgi:adenylylsulfate kinase
MAVEKQWSAANLDIGWAIWLTGLPASGKTTLALALQARLRQLGTPSVVLDSDVLRLILAEVPRYDESSRTEFYTRLVQLAEMLVRQQMNVIIAATAGRRSYRLFARTRIPRFAEVWVKCPLELCRHRDPKGLYARALAGEIHNLPGINNEYEEPIAPECVIDSSQLNPDKAIDFLLEHLELLKDVGK